MKTLVFSDTHLSEVVDLLQLDHLVKIISNADRVIINGDFWDRCLCTFDQFVNSKWQSLFPLLKARDTVYIFGNHDRQEWTDQRVNQFSVCQRKGICIKNGTKQLLVTHGDAIIPLLENLIPVHSLRFLCSRTWIRCEAAGIRLMGNRFPRVGAATNTTLKTFARQRLSENEILVCGHSHLREYDPDSNFINLGLHRQGLGQYLMVDDHAIELLEETY